MSGIVDSTLVELRRAYGEGRWEEQGSVLSSRIEFASGQVWFPGEHESSSSGLLPVGAGVVILGGVATALAWSAGTLWRVGGLAMVALGVAALVFGIRRVGREEAARMARVEQGLLLDGDTLLVWDGGWIAVGRDDVKAIGVASQYRGGDAARDWIVVETGRGSHATSVFQTPKSDPLGTLRRWVEGPM